MLRALCFVLLLCAMGTGCLESPTLPDGSGEWSCQQDKDCEKIGASAHCERGLCVLWSRSENSAREKANEADAVEGEVEKTAEGATETTSTEESPNAEPQEPLVEVTENAQETDASVENEPREQTAEEVEPENPCTKAGEVFCVDKCVDAQSDQAHCGQCNNACGGGLICTTGLCMCPKQEVLCGALCVDLKSDAGNCGQCGVSCDKAEVCEDGKCLVACAKSQTRCGVDCVDTQTDVQHCGGCGKTCLVGQVCNKSACGCPVGTTLCGGVCVNTTQDAKHCGACNNACSGALVCQKGACTAACTLPLQACGAVCADLQSDLKHCGACGKPCPVGGSCQAGVCACPTGTFDCGGVCVNTTTNVKHCGACGNACPTDTRCQLGRCYCLASNQKLCGSPQACVDTRNHPKHCNNCNWACSATQVCYSFGCQDAPYTETFAGSPVASYSNFAYPVGLLNHPSGGFLVTDVTKHQILRVHPSGSVSVFAGSGARGSADGAANVASFWGPHGMVWGPGGDLYVADTYNNRIRKISAQGQVSTFAGGNLGFQDGTVQMARFYQPTEIVFDATKSVFYVADRYNFKIRKITLAGVVSTLAGGALGYKDGASGAAVQFSVLSSLVLDNNGDLYVSDEGNHRIRKVSSANGATTTFAGNGKTLSSDGYGLNAGIPSPKGLLLLDGSLYVAEHSKIRRIDLNPASSHAVTTFSGQAAYGFLDGTVNQALYNGLHSMVFLQTGTYRNVYVTDAVNRSIRRVFFQ